MLDAGYWTLDIRYFMSYKNLEIWKLSREIVIEIHNMTLTLPKFEQFEEAQQIRRSSKSVRSTIVEGYGRRRYKNEFIKFLTYAQASNDETLDHLEILYETKSLQNEQLFLSLSEKINSLGRMMNKFIQSVEIHHQSEK
jgi:four helix bundle protein